jgi:hypothetical protein
MLQFYRHGEILVPEGVSVEEVRREALWYGLPEDVPITRRSSVVDMALQGDRGIDIVKLRRDSDAYFVQWLVLNQW